jgi:septum formation protein
MSKFLQQKPIILASSSVNRHELLASIGLEFTVHAAEIDEQAIKHHFQDEDPKQIANRLAQQKALTVSERYPHQYIIAADQLCHCEGVLFDKPLTHERALQQLMALQSKTHQQICAMAIAYQGAIIWSEQDIATLTMKPLSADTLDAYLQEDRPYHSCGSYHYEQSGKWLFQSVIGSDTSIQGLALMPLVKALEELGIVALALPMA